MDNSVTRSNLSSKHSSDDYTLQHQINEQESIKEASSLNSHNNESKFFKAVVANKTNKNSQEELKEATKNLAWQEYLREEAKFHLVEEEAQIQTSFRSLRATKVRVISKCPQKPQMLKAINVRVISRNIDVFPSIDTPKSFICKCGIVRKFQTRNETETVIKSLGIKTTKKGKETIRTIVKNGYIDSIINANTMSYPVHEYEIGGFRNGYAKAYMKNGILINNGYPIFEYVHGVRQEDIFQVETSLRMANTEVKPLLYNEELSDEELTKTLKKQSNPRRRKSLKGNSNNSSKVKVKFLDLKEQSNIADSKPAIETV